MTILSSADNLDLLTLGRRWTEDVDAPAADDERLRGVGLVASISGAWRIMPGSTLPADVRAALDAVLAAAVPAELPPAGAVAAVRVAVDGRRPPRVEGQRVYTFPPTIEVPAPFGVRIVTSDEAAAGGLIDARPASWSAQEWRPLVAGEMGPWAAAVERGRVVSLCHTPRPVLAAAAECGVWTAPANRGRHLAAAVTAAWARRVATPGRHLIYSHDWRNDASRGVARSLGLRHLGWHWTISAEPWPEGDAWGNALRDHRVGSWTPTPELEVDGGEVGDAMHPSWFFSGFADWDWWERELLPLAIASPALDLGAGAGRASLWLQDHGIGVTAVDSSPGAVGVCRARGVRDVRLGDLNELPNEKPWRLILLLCGNLGLGGSFDGNRRLLARLAEVAAPDAVLVGDTVDPGGDPDIRLRIRYKGEATPWWSQRNIPVGEVLSLVEGSGWVLDRHLVDAPDHAVLLRRS